MTKFNPENKDALTTGDLMKPAMTITTQKDADQYMEAYIEYILIRNTEMKRVKAQSIVKENLGYWAGYYDAETRERVEKLFDTKHPVFGKFIENGSPTFKEAFNAGFTLAEKTNKEDERKEKKEKKGK